MYYNPYTVKLVNKSNEQELAHQDELGRSLLDGPSFRIANSVARTVSKVWGKRSKKQ